MHDPQLRPPGGGSGIPPHPSGPAPGPYPPAQPAQQAYPGQAAYPQAGQVPLLSAHKPGIIPLRPLGVGEVIEGAFRALRSNPRAFLGLCVLVNAAVLLVIALGVGAMLGIAYLMGESDAFDTLATVGFTVGVLGAIILSLVSAQALSGMLAYAVGEATLGRYPSMGEVWRRTRGALLRLAGLCLLLALPVLVGLALLGLLIWWGVTADQTAVWVMGIVLVVAVLLATAYLGVRLALAAPALVLERLGIVAAVRRSWALTSRMFWRTLGVVVLGTLLTSVLQYVLSTVLQMIGMALMALATVTMQNETGQLVGSILMIGFSLLSSVVSSLFVQPFMAALYAMTYLDARIRKEGFDLALLRAAASAAR
ncbi:MAG: glycerophosphoryl diester phosphodiesterase membrane domain-containing protein [Micrococcales bacterium]|nr:glycerophosphoryl diester phosphodiesterase membrane domain-containing protein [Micrococcales bacterium]